ncbi:hypothetical protein FAGAP_11186 [Fusarium agapanthi]|uniref:Uncharacterized protein n=1 Tax=Fusarium agapanthi TaxID=1803897 RepID=A0A9P5AZI4_9HYPO|nr:hypothetical protein FAGAP_11186 [Fusarium agapanthi]
MDSLHEVIFPSYDRDSEPEPEPFEETLDSSCTPGKRQCAKCQKLGRRCFRCRLKLALGEESDESAKSALELAVASQAVKRNAEYENTIPEPIPKPAESKNETVRPQKVVQNRETLSTISRSSSNYRLRDCQQTPPKNRTESFHTTSHEAYFYDGVITNSTQHYESNISSRGANIQSRANEASLKPTCYLHNHRSSECKDLGSEPPCCHRSDSEIEVVKINRSWHLVSTKCHVNRCDNGGITHRHEHRYWAEPFRELPHCNSCRSLEEKKANIPEHIKFDDAKITFIERLSWRGYTHAVWVALAETPPSMPGLVIRSTNQYKVSCTVYRDQLYGPGRSAIYWAQERITGVRHSDEID